MPLLTLAGASLLIDLPLQGVLSGAATITLTQDNTAAGGTLVTSGPLQATLTPSADGLTTDLRASLYPLPAGLGPGNASLTPTIGGVTYSPIVAVLSAPLPPFPSHLIAVAEWRRRLRTLIYDEPLLTLPGEVVDVSLLTALPDAALDEALREALSAYGVWVPCVRPLPSLALAPTQTLYPLPADFDAPDLSGPGLGGWASLLGPDPLASGHYPGARHALLQRQALLDAPASSGARGRGGAGYGGGYGGGFGYGGFWANSAFAIPPTDAGGNILDDGSGLGGLGSGANRPFFYPASFDRPAPAMAFAAPPPLWTYAALRYRALWLPRRLVPTLDGTGWQADSTGALLTSVCPPGQALSDATDVLPFWAGDDAVRLTLRYAQGWALMEKILPMAETDAVKYAFFEERVGLGRKDILVIAERALGEFYDRTRRVPKGSRG